VLNTAFSHALRSNAQSEIAMINRRKLRHLELAEDMHQIDGTNFSNTEELIDAGRTAARAYLDRNL
jgi:hypothetical protein